MDFILSLGVLEMEPEASSILAKCPALKLYPLTMVSISAVPWDQLQSFCEDNAHMKVSDAHTGAELTSIGRTHLLPSMITSCP